ncbi:hypothetical protein [Winogradskyella sp. 3972H.M.0a.05]|uniref:hypothetical protein n=1 Tax=Winogradskyella sp. 3972H.M.0a.05 TaxID=2950277 RepID=UPI00339500B9
MLNKQLILLLSFVVLTTTYSTAQEEVTWKDLANVEFNRVYNEDYGIFFLTPDFGDGVRLYEGKEISIKGYFLDIAGNGEIVLLSKQPMALCFFCGGAGPETIIELHFKEKPSFKTDQVIIVNGILELNADNVDRCNYILNNVTGRLAD